MQIQKNKVILSGQIINLDTSSELKKIHQNLLTSNNSNSGGLSEDDQNQLLKRHSYRFYLSINHANGLNKECIVSCRIDSRDKGFDKIKQSLTPHKYICIIGELYQTMGHRNSTDQSYYNCVNVKYYGDWSPNLPQFDLVYVTGNIGGIIFNPRFRDLKTLKDDVDIYDVDKQLHKDKSLDVFITAYLDISKNITIFSDNIMRIKKLVKFNYSNFNKFKEFCSSYYNHIQTLQKHSMLKSVKNRMNIYSEDELFNTFNKISHYSGLYYSSKDLLNFHIAMKNKGLVILSGPSGTGKTELVRCYAETLGLLKPGNHSNHYLHIAVSPSWTDDTDLLGYFIPKNKSQGEYYPSATGLVNLLYQASQDQNRNSLYIVLLDEMNLSRVEYYFSQFLSILELPINDSKRCIRLYSDTYNNIANKYPSTIHVYNNILFVGTINVDESTKNITDKVLDRSNVIKIFSSTFKPKLFHSKNINHLEKILKYISPINMTSFNSMKNESDTDSLDSGDDVSKLRLMLLNSLNTLLKDTTYNTHEIGYREVKQINEYLCDLPNKNDLIVKKCLQKNPYYHSYDELAFDYQLSQRILDKLSGNKYELYNFISILDNYMNYHNQDKSKFHKIGVDNLSLNKISNHLDLDNTLGKALQEIPHYHSGKVIRRKWMELKYYGFTR